MKKIILSLLMLCLFNTGRAQELAFTLWLGTKPPSPNIWFYFDDDTIAYSMTGSGFTPISWYSGIEGEFLVFDLPGTMCTDTGSYTYGINGNHLTFTITDDNCASRVNTLVNYTWTQITTFVDPLNTQANISVFPNPSSDVFTITSGSIQEKTEVLLFDLNGKKVLDEMFEKGTIRVNIATLPAGAYFGQYRTATTAQMFIVDKLPK